MAANQQRPGGKAIRKNLNYAVISGNLTKTPELWRMRNELVMATLSVGCSARRKRDGEHHPYPNYFDVLVFGPEAEACCRWLRRGDHVGVQGELEYFKETVAATGHVITGVRILANYVEFGPTGPDAPYPIRERTPGQSRPRPRNRPAATRPEPSEPTPPEGGWPW